jgi:hypothetical protein
MGKWISFNLSPPQVPSVGGWQFVSRRIYATDLIALHRKILVWLKSNRTKSTRCYRMHGEDHWEQGRVPSYQVVVGETNQYIRVKFRSQRDATVFKLFFAEYLFTPDANIVRIKPIIIGTTKTIQFAKKQNYIDQLVPNNAMIGTVSEYIDKTIRKKIMESFMIPDSVLKGSRG